MTGPTEKDLYSGRQPNMTFFMEDNMTDGRQPDQQKTIQMTDYD